MRDPDLIDKIPAYVLAIAATWSVFAFGGVEPLGFGPAQVAILILAGFVFWQEGLPRLTLGTRLVLGVLIAVPLVQLIPLPVGMVESLSAFRSTVNEALSQAGVSVGTRITISAYPYETVMGILRLVCYALVFLLALRNHQVLRRQPLLAGLLIGLGIFEACYGITQYLTGFPYIFFYKKAEPVLEATGTYINRNHYAGLLEMCLPFLAAAMLNHSELYIAKGKHLWRHLMVAPQSSRVLRDVLLFVFVFIGLLVSLSRSGIVSALIGVSVASVVMFQRHRRRLFWMLPLVVIMGGAYALLIGLTPVLGRFQYLWSTVSDPELRVAIWRDTIQLIRDSPLLGTGLGTYRWSSLHYQSSLLSLRYEHAHNDLLETAAELGIPLAVLLWSALVTLLIQVIRKSARLHSADLAFTAGCAGAMAALICHSMTDFNLQIPANALIFSWIVGAGVALVHGGARSTERSSAKEVVLKVSVAE